MTEQQQQVLDFLRTQRLGVLSTVDTTAMKPQAALVAFSETAALELIFGTANDTRKFANLQRNPNVACVISGDDITLQYEGVVEVAEGEDVAVCRDIHLAKNPGAKRFAFAEKQRFCLIRPTWLRYTEYSAKPPVIFEITF